ncbi:MAG TPA: hypothetical protein VF235_02870 [Actinomycetota bacterium]
MIRRISAAVLLGLLLAAFAAPGALARDDEVRRRAACSLNSEWRLIVRRETSTTLRVRYVLDTERAGQTWSVFLSMNGKRLASVTRTTNAEGYIRITRYPVDRAGTDTISGAANGPTGETCLGSLDFPY